MKKFLSGIIAIALAIGFSAFSTGSKHSPTTTNYYWYNPVTGAPFAGNPQAEPSTGCTTAGIGCAKGFLNPDSDPVHHTPQETRKTN